MKKLVFMFVAVAAISFASCGNKAAQAPVEEEAVNDSLEMVDNDSIQNDSIVENTDSATVNE